MRTINLNKGEKIVLQIKGTLKSIYLYHQGELFLTNRRLLFINMARELFEISLDSILELKILKKAWILGVRVKQLCIIFKCGRGRMRRVYIVLTQPEKCSEMIKKSMTLMMAERWGYNGANTESTSNSQ
ncbi:hypothetical protein [Clostridium sp. ZS2-4]|uniref:hypothetical protein n=1 Tax=Clostridium sp. ZS2-4 TaxID=2987703 RepID=UPI00227A953E|nr:hypothetical protein [Clostridium sp. ZS2-4]MCY6354423.1 hypothetical protein [Clostridium sp. ZS2-4]